jgi:hypothetical protein
MKYKKFESSYILSLAVATFLFAGVTAVLAWTPPSSNPPFNNVEAPINVSNITQNKSGKLGLGGLVVFGKFQLIDGTQGAGKVLVSDANGRASWQTLPIGVTNNTTSTAQPVCSASVSASLDFSTGNNTDALKKIATLEPGTYTVSGNGSTYNTGGGGSVVAFLSTDDLKAADLKGSKLSKIVGPYSACTGCSVSKTFTYVTGPVVLGVTRNGYNDGAWTMPANSSIVVTQKSNLYIYAAQAGSTGNLNFSSKGCN